MTREEIAGILSTISLYFRGCRDNAQEGSVEKAMFRQYVHALDNACAELALLNAPDDPNRNPIKDKPIEYLGLHRKTENLLRRGYVADGPNLKLCKTIGDVVDLYLIDKGNTMCRLHGFGSYCLSDVVKNLARLGLLDTHEKESEV